MIAFGGGIPPTRCNVKAPADPGPLEDTMASTPITPELPQVLQDVAAERQRQITQGYTPEHDDGHTLGALVRLAVNRLNLLELLTQPRGARRVLVQATALLVAGIEWMDRRDG